MCSYSEWEVRTMDWLASSLLACSGTLLLLSNLSTITYMMIQEEELLYDTQLAEFREWKEINVYMHPACSTLLVLWNPNLYM